MNETTNSSGWINRTTITEYINLGGTRTYYSNYTINATNGTYTGNVSRNFTANLLDDYLTLSALDLTAPVVTLVSPANSASYTSNSQSITFEINVTDINDISNCSLIVDGVVNLVNNTVNKSVLVNFVNSFSPATYVWSVNCSDNSGNIGNSSSRTFVVSAPTETPVSTSSPSGGGGGGITKTVTVESNIVISESILGVPIVVNTIKTRSFEITNRGNKKEKIKISISDDLKEIVSIDESSFDLDIGNRKEISIRIIAPESPGIYTGKIFVNGQEVLVNINVNTKELLFDVGIVIPQQLKSIRAGDKLESEITLIPMGEKPRLDVTLNYYIKDFNGRTFLTESETLLVEGQKTFKKEFRTQNLIDGDYILGMELIYPSGVAVSTSHFEIKRTEIPAIGDYRVVLLVLGIGIAVLVTLTVIMLRKHSRTIRLSKKKRYKR